MANELCRKRQAHRTLAALFVAVSVIATGLVAIPAVAQPARGATTSCGAPGKPDCAMQRWMKRKLSSPRSNGDLGTVETNLRQLAARSPDKSWDADWRRLAMAASLAAQKRDRAATTAACKTCHDTFRDRYRVRFSELPVPD